MSGTAHTRLGLLAILFVLALPAISTATTVDKCCSVADYVSTITFGSVICDGGDCSSPFSLNSVVVVDPCFHESLNERVVGRIVSITDSSFSVRAVMNRGVCSCENLASCVSSEGCANTADIVIPGSASLPHACVHFFSPSAVDSQIQKRSLAEVVQLPEMADVEKLRLTMDTSKKYLQVSLATEEFRIFSQYADQGGYLASEVTRKLESFRQGYLAPEVKDALSRFFNAQQDVTRIMMQADQFARKAYHVSQGPREAVKEFLEVCGPKTSVACKHASTLTKPALEAEDAIRTAAKMGTLENQLLAQKLDAAFKRQLSISQSLAILEAEPSRAQRLAAMLVEVRPGAVATSHQIVQAEKMAQRIIDDAVKTGAITAEQVAALKRGPQIGRVVNDGFSQLRKNEFKAASQEAKKMVDELLKTCATAGPTACQQVKTLQKMARNVDNGVFRAKVMMQQTFLDEKVAQNALQSLKGHLTDIELKNMQEMIRQKGYTGEEIIQKLKAVGREVPESVGNAIKSYADTTNKVAADWAKYRALVKERGQLFKKLRKSVALYKAGALPAASLVARPSLAKPNLPKDLPKKAPAVHAEMVKPLKGICGNPVACKLADETMSLAKKADAVISEIAALGSQAKAQAKAVLAAETALAKSVGRDAVTAVKTAFANNVANAGKATTDFASVVAKNGRAMTAAAHAELKTLVDSMKLVEKTTAAMGRASKLLEALSASINANIGAVRGLAVLSSTGAAQSKAAASLLQLPAGSTPNAAQMTQAKKMSESLCKAAIKVNALSTSALKAAKVLSRVHTGMEYTKNFVKVQDSLNNGEFDPVAYENLFYGIVDFGTGFGWGSTRAISGAIYKCLDLDNEDATVLDRSEGFAICIGKGVKAVGKFIAKATVSMAKSISECSKEGTCISDAAAAVTKFSKVAYVKVRDSVVDFGKVMHGAVVQAAKGLAECNKMGPKACYERELNTKIQRLDAVEQGVNRYCNGSTEEKRWFFCKMTQAHSLGLKANIGVRKLLGSAAGINKRSISA